MPPENVSFSKSVSPGPPEKLAVSVIGPFIVTFPGLFGPVYDPDPIPVHPVKLNPLFGVAVIVTPCPLLKKALEGLTPPPAPAFIVRKYCVVKFAVYVVPTVGATVCDIAPPSLQLLHKYWIPVPPLCGVVVPIV
jgi:hypothetical protein